MAVVQQEPAVTVQQEAFITEHSSHYLTVIKFQGEYIPLDRPGAMVVFTAVQMR